MIDSYPDQNLIITKQKIGNSPTQVEKVIISSFLGECMSRYTRSGPIEEIPQHVKVSREIVEEIQIHYKPGDFLPSEGELGKHFKVNRHTLRMAIEELVTRGIVGKLQGKGTIVLQKKIDYPIHCNTRFTETLENAGRQPESKVLRKIGIPAQGEVADRLSIKEGEPVILIETLRNMDGATFSMVTHYFPLEKVYDVMRKYEGGSLHKFISDRYGITLVRTLSLICAKLPDETDIATLEISANAPVLQVKSVNVNEENGEPLEFVVSRFKGMSTQLSVDLSGMR